MIETRKKKRQMGSWKWLMNTDFSPLIDRNCEIMTFGGLFVVWFIHEKSKYFIQTEQWCENIDIDIFPHCFRLQWDERMSSRENRFSTKAPCWMTHKPETRVCIESRSRDERHSVRVRRNRFLNRISPLTWKLIWKRFRLFPGIKENTFKSVCKNFRLYV